MLLNTKQNWAQQMAIGLLCSTLGGYSSLSVFPAAAAETNHAAEATLENVTAWVRDLDAKEFETRKLATEHLIQAGPVALDPVAKAMVDSDLEVMTRGIYILQQLGANGDDAVEDNARRVLTRLAAQRTTVVARRATESLAILNAARQEKSLKKLSDLGAVVIPDHVEPGVSVAPTLCIEFGSKWTGTVDDLELLSWIRAVQQVTFRGSQVTDEWLTYLHGMQHLAAIKLVSARVTDEGFANLNRVPVRNLLLQYMPVSDAAIPHLTQIVALSHVRAFGTAISLKGKLTLEDGGVRVDRRKGAFLGVTVDPNEKEWRIARVTAGSAADKAGLKPLDVVIRYGDQPVASFEDLTSLISRNDVGDTVTLVIRRNNREMEKSVTFGPWN